MWLVVALATGAALPIWDSDHLGPLSDLIRQWDQSDVHNFSRRHTGNLARLIILIVVACGPLAACLITRRRRTRPDMAPDYADGPRGAVQDGRADPPTG